MADTNPNPPIEPRVAVLERMAAETREALSELRNEMRSEFHDVRTEMRGLRDELHAEARDIRATITRLTARTATLTGITSILGVAVIAILISQAALWQQLGRLDGQLSAMNTQLTEIAAMLRTRSGG